MALATSTPIWSYEPAFLRKVTELTEYVIVSDEEYEVLVWEIELRVGEEWVLYSRRYAHEGDLEEEPRVKYNMIYNGTANTEAEAVSNFNEWVYSKLRKLFQ